MREGQSSQGRELNALRSREQPSRRQKPDDGSKFRSHGVLLQTAIFPAVSLKVIR